MDENLLARRDNSHVKILGIFLSDESKKEKKKNFLFVVVPRGYCSRLQVIVPLSSPKQSSLGKRNRWRKKAKKELPETQCNSGIFTPNLPPFHDLHANVPPARTYSFPAPLFQILSARKREREMSQREEEEEKKPCTGET